VLAAQEALYPWQFRVEVVPLKDRVFASKNDRAKVLAIVDDFLGLRTVVGSLLLKYRL